MKQPKEVGVLIGVGPKEPGDAEYDQDDGAMDSEETERRELKVTAARALLSAMKGNDPSAFVDALDAYMEV